MSSVCFRFQRTFFAELRNVLIIGKQKILNTKIIKMLLIVHTVKRSVGGDRGNKLFI